MASTEWKRARFKQAWHEGETLSVAIGQGYNLATPFQMAQVATAIASGGIIYQPQIIEKVESPLGEVLFQFQPVVKYRLGRARLPSKRCGRAWKEWWRKKRGREGAFLPNIQIAGKTGTAQVVTVNGWNRRKRAAKRPWWAINMRTTPGLWAMPRRTTPGWPWRCWWSTAATAAPSPVPWPGGSSPPP